MFDSDLQTLSNVRLSAVCAAALTATYGAPPGAGSSEVTEVGVKGLDRAIAHQVNHIYICQASSQLLDHLPEVVGQHLVQLALITTQMAIP